jgi:hypothetical protein
VSSHRHSRVHHERNHAHEEEEDEAEEEDGEEGSFVEKAHATAGQQQEADLVQALYKLVKQVLT